MFSRLVSTDLTREMKALRYLPSGEVELCDIHVPVPGPDRVRLAVAGAGICRSHVRIAEGTPVGTRGRIGALHLGARSPVSSTNG